MKVIVEEKERGGIKFPCLMKSKVSGIIVLFSGDQEGVVLYVDSVRYPIGHHAYDWDMDSFEPFRDRLILENQEWHEY